MSDANLPLEHAELEADLVEGIERVSGVELPLSGILSSACNVGLGLHTAVVDLEVTLDHPFLGDHDLTDYVPLLLCDDLAPAVLNLTRS